MHCFVIIEGTFLKTMEGNKHISWAAKESQKSLQDHDVNPTIVNSSWGMLEKDVYSNQHVRCMLSNTCPMGQVVFICGSFYIQLIHYLDDNYNVQCPYS